MVAVVAVVLLALGAAAGIWAAVSGGSGSRPAAGCVSVLAPSVVGGATIHYCGAAARQWCAEQYTSAGPLAGRARGACREAGFGPPAGR